MRYEKIKRLPEGQFRRLTGVKPKTFEQMLEVLTLAERWGLLSTLGIAARLD